MIENGWQSVRKWHEGRRDGKWMEKGTQGQKRDGKDTEGWESVGKGMERWKRDGKGMEGRRGRKGQKKGWKIDGKGMQGARALLSPTLTVQGGFSRESGMRNSGNEAPQPIPNPFQAFPTIGKAPGLDFNWEFV